MKDREIELIHKAQKGDSFAFEQLISSYDRQVLSLAYSIVGNSDDAQDIYQEALISAYKALPKFRMQSDFFTWLYRIAVNKAINFKRKKLKYRVESLTKTDSESYGSDHDLRISSSEIPEEVTVQKELKDIIEEAVLLLSARERMAFVLCHQQGYKLREAAELMDCTLGTVKSYLFRSREKLKINLKSYMEN